MEQRHSRLQAEATFYRGATFLLLVVVVLESGYIVWHANRARFARAIRIEGQIVCFVRNAKAAELVNRRLLADRKGDLPGEAVLEQRWEDLNSPLNAQDKVLSVNAAVERLKPRVSAKVAAFAIRVGKQSLVVMPDEERARLALDTLKKEYAGTDAQEVGFLQKDVFVTETQAQPKAVVRDVGQAVAILKDPPVGTTKYVVASEEEGWAQIADRFRTTVGELRRLNPQVGRVLHARNKLTITTPLPRIVVVSVKETAREVPYVLPPEKQETDTLDRGVTREAVAGVAGKKAITERVTYHNGKRVSAQKVSEKIIRPAVAERIMVGTRAPVSDETNAETDG